MATINQSQSTSTTCCATPLWEPRDENYFDPSDDTLFIGFDTESQKLKELNHLLSYQFFACNRQGPSWRGIKIMDGKRFKLSTFLSWVVQQGMRQGMISTWPSKITLVGHFTLAGLALFSDFQCRKHQLNSIRRTFISLQPFRCRLYDQSSNHHQVTVTVRDSMLVSPDQKQSLKALGDLIGKETLELVDEEIENMEDFIREDPARFKDYALRDPEICVRYCLRIAALNKDLIGEFEIPPTLSSIGVKYLLHHWGERKICRHAVLGTEMVRENSWFEERKVLKRKKCFVSIQERFLQENLVTECYHGGRNEQYLFGAGEVGIWTDWDLAGAYTTALSLIGLPAWRGIRQSCDLDEFQPDVLGFARVRFRFPYLTKFPCLPVRVASGLLFPLTGESYCAAPEIFLARSLGAELEILSGIIVPCSFELRPFESFIVDCTKSRQSFPKGSLDELLWKEIGNSTYGKVAQGLKRKRCFDSRTGSHKDLPPSEITNPYFAAFTTSFIRAVLGEILARLPLDASVCNATTDGFLTNASDEDVMTATKGPLCQLFAQARVRICGDGKTLDPKHRIAQPLGWRTRGQATIESIPGQNIVLAKAGLKAPTGDKEQQNEWTILQFMNRSRDSKQTFTTLRNLPEIWKTGSDLVQEQVTRRISMEYDWKRRPTTAGIRPIRSTNHLYFETVPWPSEREFNKCREAWDAFQSQHPVVLKTECDLIAFQEYREMTVGISGLKKPRQAPALTLAKRMFLRALVRSAWGLRADRMSYSETAKWLTEGGFPATKKSDLENAKRPSAKLVEHVVSRTTETDRFVSFIKATFPEFDESKLFSLDLRGTG